jgi:hypothetical protein
MAANRGPLSGLMPSRRFPPTSPNHLHWPRWQCSRPFELLGRRPAPAALNRRDDLNAICRIGHRHGFVCLTLDKWGDRVRSVRGPSQGTSANGEVVLVPVIRCSPLRIRHPEPNGSRRATPPSLTQRQPGQFTSIAVRQVPDRHTRFTGASLVDCRTRADRPRGRGAAR